MKSEQEMTELWQRGYLLFYLHATENHRYERKAAINCFEDIKIRQKT